MPDRPDAMDLIALAREALITHVLPQLAHDARYQGLMVIGALAIAARELTQGEPSEERAALCELYGERMGSDLSLRAMNERLARDIRSGDMDGALEPRVRRYLRARARARLAISNPRRVETQSQGR